MLRNYFKIAWRQVARRKFYSLVNVLGLSVGIAFYLADCGRMCGAK